MRQNIFNDESGHPILGNLAPTPLREPFGAPGFQMEPSWHPYFWQCTGIFGTGI